MRGPFSLNLCLKLRIDDSYVWTFGAAACALVALDLESFEHW